MIIMDMKSIPPIVLKQLPELEQLRSNIVQLVASCLVTQPSELLLPRVNPGIVVCNAI